MNTKCIYCKNFAYHTCKECGKTICETCLNIYKQEYLCNKCYLKKLEDSSLDSIDTGSFIMISIGFLFSIICLSGADYMAEGRILATVPFNCCMFFVYTFFVCVPFFYGKMIHN